MKLTKRSIKATTKTTTKSRSSASTSNELDVIASFTSGRKPVLTPSAVATPVVVKKTKRNALLKVKATDGLFVQFWASAFTNTFHKVDGMWHLKPGARCEAEECYPPEKVEE